MASLKFNKKISHKTLICVKNQLSMSYVKPDELKKEVLKSIKEGEFNEKTKEMFLQMLHSKLTRYDFKDEWRKPIIDGGLKDLCLHGMKMPNTVENVWAYMSQIIGCSIARTYTKLYKESKTKVIHL